MKIKRQRQNYAVVNHIPKTVMKKLENSEIHPFLKNLNLNSYLKLESSMFFTLRNLLFYSIENNPSVIRDYKSLKSFIDGILKEFYSFQSEGFVNRRGLECNKIFNVFRSIYPQYNEIFRVDKRSLISWRYELEHFHNLIILILLFEVELYLKNHVVSVDSDLESEELTFLKEDRSNLNSLLSGGIRNSLSKNRLLIVERLYVGFDTEYKSLDSTHNKILCYTTSTLTESLIKIRSKDVDFSLKDGLIHQPQTSNLIRTGVNLIRFLRNKRDFELDELSRFFQKDESLSCLVLYNQDLLFKKNSIDIDLIKSNFFDLRQDPSVYSFKNLLDEILVGYKPVDYSNFYTRSLTDFNPTIKKECFLTAHFTTADVSSFSDFDEIKDRFTVLNKSFLTLDKLISYKK